MDVEHTEEKNGKIKRKINKIYGKIVLVNQSISICNSLEWLEYEVNLIRD